MLPRLPTRLSIPNRPPSPISTSISSPSSLTPSPVMATATTMPARGHSSTPKFTADQPRELQQYFQELEILLNSACIINAQIMKKHACHYLDVDSAELWESIAEYAAPSTFDEFKRAIFKLYPGSEDERK